MIVLDTNVVSELWKPAPSSRVVGWIDAQMLETLYLSAVTVAELRFGLAAMPIGKRRALYLTRLEGEVLPAFRGRVLSFDLDASQAYADLMRAPRQRAKPSASPMASSPRRPPHENWRSQRATPAHSRRRG